MMRSNIKITSSISCIRPKLACVASVSVRFRRKGRGTRVKDREKSGASKRVPLFHFLVLVSFLERSKPKVPFLGISLPRNQTETLATQAMGGVKYSFVDNINKAGVSVGSFLVNKVKNHSSHTCRMTCGQDIKHKTVWKKEHTQYTCVKLVLTYMSKKLKMIEFDVMTEDYRVNCS